MLSSLTRKNVLFIALCVISCNFIGYNEILTSQEDTSNTGYKGISNVYIAESNVPMVASPVAGGKDIRYSAVSEVDLTNVNNGYIMIKYTGENEKVKVQLIYEGDKTTTYDLYSNGEYKSLPITNGTGYYTLTVNENISGIDYRVAHAVDFYVELINEYEPFLYTNQFINFNENSSVVPLSSEVAKTSTTQIEEIEAIFNYVAKNIDYDDEKASMGGTFYMPDIEETLTTQKGICIDYAALTVAMLRSRGIPAKLVVGYVDDVFHAWVSVYTEETGTIGSDIIFTGEGWVLLDPTLESTGYILPGIPLLVGNDLNYDEVFVL